MRSHPRVSSAVGADAAGPALVGAVPDLLEQRAGSDRREGRDPREDGPLCLCGHGEEAHDHHRPGRDCGVCGAAVCSRFRRAW